MLESGVETTAGVASDEIQPYSYEGTLHGPLFFASEEGSVIRTDPTVAATALMHAIGYTYYDLQKRYLLQGEDTVEPDYSHLTGLPFFVSEMTPTDRLEATERTFRTVSYATERTVITSDNAVGEFLTGSKKPVPRGIEGSNSGWHKVREYVGIPPDSSETDATFTFTIWTTPDHAPPESMGLRLGIKRTGELRAKQTDSPAETVSLNQFLLQSTYEIGDERISELLRRADQYDRGTDVRTCRFHGVDRSWADEDLMPAVLGG